MTSNLGSEYILDDDINKEELVNNELKKTFRPEFINRIDEIVIFNSLNKDVIYDILDLTIKNIELRLRDKHLTLSLTDEARNKCVTESYDVRYGARQIKRYVSKHIESLIANELIMDNIIYGSHILIDVKNNDFIIK